MKTHEIIAYYGTQQKVADALDIEQSNIAKWLKAGEPPYLRQLELQILTKGKLKAVPKNSRASVKSKSKLSTSALIV